MKRSVKRVIALAAAAAVCAGAYAGYSKVKPQGTAVDRAVASSGPMKDTCTVTGTITGASEIVVLSELSGSVREICVEKGQTVAEGDVLLRLDTTALELQLKQARAQQSAYSAQAQTVDIARLMSGSPSEYLTSVQTGLEEARSASEEAGRQFDAAQELYDAGAASKDDLERARLAKEQADDALKQAEMRSSESASVVRELGLGDSALNSRYYSGQKRQVQAMAEAQGSAALQIEDAIARCEVKAPSAGTVRELPAKNANLVGAGQTVAVIAPEAEELLVEADVLTTAAPYLEIGSPVTVKLEYRGGNRSFSGAVCDIADHAFEDISALGLKENKVHIKVRPQEGEDLSGLEGYSAKLTLTLFEKDDVVSIPSSAVFEEDGIYSIFVIEDGLAVRKTVEAGYSSPSRTEILSGLSEGDEIIDRVESEGVYEGAQVRYED